MAFTWSTFCCTTPYIALLFTFHISSSDSLSTSGRLPWSDTNMSCVLFNDRKTRVCTECFVTSSLKSELFTILTAL